MARTVDREASYYQQLLTALILQRQGQTPQAIELAQRILQRATGARESTMALLAGDLIQQMGGLGPDPLRQMRFLATQRSWSEIDHRRRFCDIMAEELLVCKRHRTDDRYLQELSMAQPMDDHHDIPSRLELFDKIGRALVVQQLLRQGRNLEVCRATSGALLLLRRNREVRPAWLDVWYLTAHVRSLTAQGLFDDVLGVTGSLQRQWLARGHLAHEFLRHRMLAAMRTESWIEAKAALAQIDALTNELTDNTDLERRALLAAYLQLARHLRLLPDPSASAPLNFTPLISSVSIIMEDRKGLGALVLIHDAIGAFLYDDPDTAERKVLNLQVYASRNLRTHGSSALRGFINYLRMLIIHGESFLENPRRVRRFTDTFTVEFDATCDQAVCPLNLAKLAGALTGAVLRRQG